VKSIPWPLALATALYIWQASWYFFDTRRGSRLRSSGT